MRTTLRRVGPLAILAMSALQIPTSMAGELGGAMEAEVNGRSVQLPTVSSDITATIDGDIARVTVRQVFENPEDTPLNATYLFPLQEDAAVHAMTMQVGDDIIRAVIKRKEEAEETFEAATVEGKAAALLVQHRPNMFTQDVANLMPGLPVTVEITYAQTVPRIAGGYELVIPTVVGPRYMPGTGEDHVTDLPRPSQVSPEGWEFEPPPAYPQVAGLTIPDTVDPARLSISATLRAGTAVTALSSTTHDILTDGPDTARRLTLRGGKAIPNRDFVLRYDLSGDAPEAGVLTHTDERGTFFSLLIEPPRDVPDADVTPREVVFVLDTSGSMQGQPMEASKAFMQSALAGLRDSDAFRIIQFSNSPAEFSRGAVPATRRNVEAASAYVSRLSGGGGTEVIPAMDQAFRLAPERGRMRIVVFLSDGYIGYEGAVLERLSETMGDARIYAFGVGSSVNRYLLEEMATRGRGIARYIDPTETGHEAAEALARRIEAPLLTNITIDWGDLDVIGATPALIPDLFAGQAVRVTGRIEGGTSEATTIELTGQVAGRTASLPVALDVGGAAEHSAIPTIWARTQVADLMAELTTPEEMRRAQLSDAEIQDRITELGLGYDLVTQYTSFVAVSEKVVNADPAANADAQVALEQAAGVPNTAYPKASFGGSSAPEPGIIGMLLVMLGVVGVVSRTKRAA